MPPDGLGYGRGLMQIDFDAHEFGRDGQWADPVENIMYGAMVLRDARRYLAAKTSLYGVALLQAAIAAYNCGAGNVIASIVRERSVDTRTAHGNYSEDVLDRADWYKRKDSK
jgi:hypothetical protein